MKNGKDVDDLIKKLEDIKNSGWVTTHRGGATGIGYTLENLLAIEENNQQLPDWKNIELKSTRKDVKSSMLTMFTLSPLPRGSNTILRNKYGYIDEVRKGQKIIHTTLSADRFTEMKTGNKLKIVKNFDNLHIASNVEIENIFWSKDRIEKAFLKKIPKEIVLVKANNRNIGKEEQFWFNEAYLLSDFDFDSFMKLIEDGVIYIDLRIGQYPNGKTHDHGTAFRIKEDCHSLLFKKIENIL